MKLLEDEFNGVYVWVEELDENIELSPHFDYEEDAIQWRDTMKTKLSVLDKTPDMWAVTAGYAPCDNTTELLCTLDSITDSYTELLNNKNLFGPHSMNETYIKSGPLRECTTLHLIPDRNNRSINDIEFSATSVLINRLKNKIDPVNDRTITRAYVTIVPPGKNIYSHSDTDGAYWGTINRYQLYYTGDENMVQLINDTLFPVAPGYLYYFDHRQIHEYKNNSNQDLVLMVFDLLK